MGTTNQMESVRRMILHQILHHRQDRQLIKEYQT